LGSAKKWKGSSRATFAEWSPGAGRLTEWAPVAFVRWRLFKSNADLAVLAAVKGQVVAVLQVVLGDF
jgi:hypothetical protein